MGCLQEFVIDLQTSMDQPARVFRSQNRRCLGKAAPRQNLAVGHLFRYYGPQPVQLRLHFPAGLVHIGQLASACRVPQRVPSGFGFARHPLDRPANPASAHDQSKALLQNGGGIGMRQSLQLVHQHSQGHRLRPHLHRRGSDRIGGL